MTLLAISLTIQFDWKNASARKDLRTGNWLMLDDVQSERLFSV
jgi:hypothetical protein